MLELLEEIVYKLYTKIIKIYNNLYLILPMIFDRRPFAVK